MEIAKPIFKEPTENHTDFIARMSPVKTIDKYKEMLEELFLVRNPKFKFIPDHETEFISFLKERQGSSELSDLGEWVYFPWNGILMHILSDVEHQEMRTARNKNIITKEEQDRLYHSTIAIAGLSVGSHTALTISMMGMAREMRIADPDTISGSNLNRIRYDYTKIEEGKCQVLAESLYQMNPYADIKTFPHGVNDANMSAFLDGAQILFEETDDLEMKIRLRLEARKRAIPVVMGTDNGDGVIVDIERFDKDPQMQLFNGVIGNINIEEFKKFPPQELPKLATKIAGSDVVVPRMLTSLTEVGKSLYSWPQLGDAATLCGVTTAYVAKRILLGEPVREGKIEVNLDAIFDPNYDTKEATTEREGIRINFLKGIGLM